jgi:hypothetical protein
VFPALFPRCSRCSAGRLERKIISALVGVPTQRLFALAGVPTHCLCRCSSPANTAEQSAVGEEHQQRQTKVYKLRSQTNKMYHNCNNAFLPTLVFLSIAFPPLLVFLSNAFAGVLHLQIQQNKSAVCETYQQLRRTHLSIAA